MIAFACVPFQNKSYTFKEKSVNKRKKRREDVKESNDSLGI